jgi:TolB protein
MHLVRPDGADERALLLADGNLEPAFSPDGRRVAFRSYLNGDDPDGEIMIVDAAGGNLRRLTDNTVEEGYPAFSADGRSLFFHRTVEDFQQIIVLDLETGAENQLTGNDSNSWHAHPSPDGRQIVYDGNRAGNRDIYLMDLENQQVTQLTSDLGRDGYPKFSSDGRRIAFHSDRGGSTAIYIMNADGSEQVPVIPRWIE